MAKVPPCEEAASANRRGRASEALEGVSAQQVTGTFPSNQRECCHLYEIPQFGIPASQVQVLRRIWQQFVYLINDWIRPCESQRRRQRRDMRYRRYLRK